MNGADGSQKTDGEKSRFGFKNNDNADDEYLGKFVCVEQTGGHSVLGILSERDSYMGRAYFRPYIIGKGDGRLGIVSDDRTKMDFPLTVIRVIPGTIEEYVDAYNRELEEKEKKNTRRKR